ncbi:MAG: putative rane protein with lysine transferase [Frankiales bacterium]|nr:putative rane protein with lysine transferase [Frankiales bacterium]
MPDPVRDRLAGVAGLLVLVAGVVGVVSGLVPAERGRLRLVVDLLGLPVAAGAAATSVTLGVLLVLVARGLRRRQRRAWAVAVPLLVLAAVVHVVKGLDVEEALLDLVGLAVLLVTRDSFRADPDPDERAHPVQLFLQLLSASVVVGLVLVHREAAGSLGAQLQTVLRGLVGLSGPAVVRPAHLDLVDDVLLWLGALTLLVPVFSALRTGRDRQAPAPADLDRVRALLDARPDGDSLGWFALRDDKQLVFSRTGKAAVSYRVVAGVALASGDPLGDPEAWPGAIAAFLDRTCRHGWTPAVLGCSERGGTAWSRAGLLALEVGDEAVLDTTTFTLEGRAMRDVRQSVNRTERAGLAVQVRRVGEVPAEELDRLRVLAASWRDGPVERGFSMALGRLGGPGDERCVVATATRDGQVQALLHFVPWGDDGLSLDLMRRARGTDNGVNELLITRAVLAAPGLGVRRVSLNFALFRRALEQGGRLGAGPVLRRWRALLLLASRVWQIDSLYRFNDKFGPAWTPRYVCYRRPSDLPRVVVAGLQAEAFLPQLPWS